MNRRSFIISSGVLATAAVTGVVAWNQFPVNDEDLSIETTIAFLEQLNTNSISSKTSWSLATTFQHMAQSIDYSIDGYPQHKPDWFKSTIGKAAFYAFSSKRTMRHNLEEPIPGAPEATTSLTSDNAKSMLINALKRFDAFNGPLKPHFAYGDLNKQEYALAHVMHIKNHFNEIQ